MTSPGVRVRVFPLTLDVSLCDITGDFIARLEPHPRVPG